MVLAMLASICAYAQNTINFKITSEDEEPLIGASVIAVGKNIGVVADEKGIAKFENLPDGIYKFSFSYIGYEPLQKTITLPLEDSEDVIEIELEEEENELEEVVISATRGTRTFQDTPSRVEFIGSEELEEKNVMKPGDIRMLLSESTGIQTQQTSAISGNAAIKIQGLDGRYTQILKDGFPVFSGAASGLGLLQTPPLDLRQVEIIKGSSSTLYGGGAIAGLVNLVTKTPTEKRDFQVQLNGTTAKGLDANVFYGQRFNKVGTTIFASYNRNWAYDPSDVGFTAIPDFNRFTLNPSLYMYFSDRSKLIFGIESMIENRLGGDIYYIKHGKTEEHSYFERNKSQRYSTKLSFDHQFNDNNRLYLKNSVTLYKRKIEIPDYLFDGDQWTSFSEASYVLTREKTEWVGGITVNTDHFGERTVQTIPSRNYTINSYGVFAQNTTTLSEKFIIEAGLRGDYVYDYGFVILPRISGLYKPFRNFSIRLGGGFGYKPPSIFTEESERLSYENILPMDKNESKLERSYGANLDFNYRTSFADGRVIFSVNQLFFYTYLRHPLELKNLGNGFYEFYNINGHMDSKGSETNIKVMYHDFNLFLGYTYTDAKVREGNITSWKTLAPKHRVNAVLMWEIEDSWRVGYECYYTGKQVLTDGNIGKDYVTMGIMVQKIWDHFSVYANFENFTDRRQTRFDIIYTGAMTDPVFRDIYAPLEGFVANFGIIFRFYQYRKQKRLNRAAFVLAVRRVQSSFR